MSSFLEKKFERIDYQQIIKTNYQNETVKECLLFLILPINIVDIEYLRIFPQRMPV